MKEININSSNFEAEVLKSDIPVMIDFWAGWCGPCKMLSPIISEIADENEGDIKVCKVNVDQEAELASKFNVASIPTVVIMKNGNVTNISVGYKPKKELLKLL